MAEAFEKNDEKIKIDTDIHNENANENINNDGENFMNNTNVTNCPTTDSKNDDDLNMKIEENPKIIKEQIEDLSLGISPKLESLNINKDEVSQETKIEEVLNKDLLEFEEDFAPEYKELCGFKLNDRWELRDKDGKCFEYNRFKDDCLNQHRYEQIGEAVTHLIYNLLESHCDLRRIFIPINPSDNEPQSFFFSSDVDDVNAEDKLLILIHGTGVVRAGQWARRIIINHNLMDGSQMPYILQAKKENYHVIVLNTNLSHRDIRGSESAEDHANYVWENFIAPNEKYKHIAIVAHSYGGSVVVDMVKRQKETFLDRVFAVAFTDAGVYVNGCDEKIKAFFKKKAQNWVASDFDLDVPIPCFFDLACSKVSAGHPQHEWTSTTSKDSVFVFLKKKYEEKLNNVELEDVVDNDNEIKDKGNIIDGDAKAQEEDKHVDNCDGETKYHTEFSTDRHSFTVDPVENSELPNASSMNIKSTDNNLNASEVISDEREKKDGEVSIDIIETVADVVDHSKHDDNLDSSRCN